MVIPDLTRLTLHAPIARTLWDYLIEQKVAKDKDCDKFVFPVQNNKDSSNCAQEGFLMCKTIPQTVCTDGHQKLGRTLTVQIEGGERVLQAVPRGDETTRRAVFYKSYNQSWISQYFNNNCVQYEEIIDRYDNGKVKTFRQDGIVWDVDNKGNKRKEESEFFKTLVKWTDFMYLDGVGYPGQSRGDKPEVKGRGLLFMKMFEDDTQKKSFDMPYENEFRHPYMYVILMCARNSKGFGSELMQIAIEAAFATGCTRIALSALPNAVEFYMGKFGFQFVNRSGDVINTDRWVKRSEDGKMKLTLHTEESGEGVGPSSSTPGAACSGSEGGEDGGKRTSKRHKGSG